MKNIDHIAMDMNPSYIHGAKEYLPSSRIVFDHFHVINMMNDSLDRIGRKKSRENAILKRAKYDYLKNPFYLSEKERDYLISVKSLDL